ncbi:hypothetical protein LAJ19_20155 (plasmid) [Deinococcus taeanensis]|uniref:hypothetical protein n=1 Tax=Deinococcus taeanensis TaxID=2737050 RepID=UPI001CDD146C|nr:hypothetical protein [Deinococcus taeanensis]UBV45442.1 hypothetical protein LAJ19_20155 [Deinococcus taeanensis]
MQSDRAKAADKAAKVFRHGVSTTAAGEKEKCIGVLLNLLTDYNLNLSDLDPSFPKTADLPLLRQKMGLTATGTAGAPGAPGQRDREEQARQQAAHHRAPQAQPSHDPEVALWSPLKPTDRRHLLDSELFTRSLLGVKSTTAYPRLLADLRIHDLSPAGGQLGDTLLVELLDRLLTRPGRTISCAYRLQTLFDDLYSACLEQYQTAATVKREQEDRQKQREAEQRRERTERTRKEREQQERARAQQRRAEVSRDPEVMLFQHLDAEQRKRVLHGPVFSRGILQAIDGTSAYRRLLAELSQLDRSAAGVQLGDQELLRWLEGVLVRQGSAVQPRHGSNTMFDDVLAHCRFTYAQHAEQLRQETARTKAEAARQKAAADARRQAAAAGSQGSWGRHGSGSAARDPAQTPRFTRSFDDVQEARLYLHLARRHLGSRGELRSYSRGEQWHVELCTAADVRDEINLAFRTVLHELQRAAMNHRLEAARVRDETIQRAQKECEVQSAQSFRTAVDAYFTRVG